MKIFVTHKIPGDHIEKLKSQGHEVFVDEGLEKIKDSDAVLSLLTDRIDGDLMDMAGPQLKIISNYAVGFDNINIIDATDRGIVVTNTPSDEVDEAVAEHTWALISGLTRRIVESDEFIRQEGYFAGSGGYRGWKPDLFLGTSLIGKTLGIVGMGGIGTMVARRAQGYNMKIIYTKRTKDQNSVDLDTLLKESDVVSLHVPLTEETRHMINGETLSKMKKGSFLVNTARGPVVNEADLVESLKSGHLAGAGLDVFDNEPNISSELIAMPNVILTPHIASATWEARNKMGEMATDAIISVFSDKMPQNIVNEKVWENRRK